MKPLLCVLLQTSMQEHTHAWRHAMRQSVPCWVALDDRSQCFRDIFSAKRPLPRKHLVEHAPERPNVAAPIDWLAPSLLGTHVRRRAEQHTDAGHHRG